MSEETPKKNNILDIIIESRHNNNLTEAPTLEIDYGRIHLFEYGFDLQTKIPNKQKKLKFEVLKKGKNFLQGYILCNDNPSYKLCINNKSSPKTKFGYNDIGALTTIFTLNGKDFQTNQFNSIVLFSLDDSDIFDKAYWWGRFNNELFAHLNEIYKSVFYLYIPENEIFSALENQDIDIN